MIISRPLSLRWVFSACVMLLVAQTGYSEPLGRPILPDGASHYYGDGSAIVVDVKHGQQNFRFFLDTGSTFTILDSATFGSIFEPFEGQSDSDEVSAEIKGVAQLKHPGSLAVLGRFPIRSKALYHASLSRFTSGIGEKIHGVLGCDFLKDYVVEVHGDDQFSRILPSKDSIQGQCVTLSWDKYRRPIVYPKSEELFLNGTPSRFMLDTGAVGTCAIQLQHDLFQMLLERGQITVDGKSSSLRIDRILVSREGELKRFQLWSNVSNIRIKETSVDECSLVGLSYLMQFNFTIDFPNSKLYLQPRKTKLNLLHQNDMSGLGVLREESDLVVRRVDPQSPAAKADVRVGDIVVLVNGVPAQKLRLFPLRNSLCEAGKTVQLGMRRGTKEWTVDLELRDWRNSASEKDFE